MTTTLTQRKAKDIASYTVLKTRVREALRLGRERAQVAVEREKVRTSWEIGKLVNEHILLNRARANYGEQVLKRLSADISISARELHYMVEFARATPIVRTSAQLSWGHHQALLRVNDDQERAVLARRAEKNDWTVKELRREIAKLKEARPKAVKAALKEPLLEAQKGIPYTYQIVKLEGRLQIDLGFSNYLSVRDAVPEKITKSSRAVFEAKASNVKISTDGTSATGQKYLGASLKEGDIIQIKPGSLRARQGSVAGEAISIRKNATQADLYTYNARVLAITDADTLWVFIDLGFGITTVQQLRLRGLDAPEISSRDGQAAKKFVEKQLKVTVAEKMSKSSRAVHGALAPCIITSSKSDKYDRYLADVFIPKKHVILSEAKDLESFVYLNNELLKRGLATRV